MTPFAMRMPRAAALGGSVSLTGMAPIGTKEAQRSAMRERQHDAVAEFEEKRWAVLAALTSPPAKKASRARFDRNAYQRKTRRPRGARHPRFQKIAYHPLRQACQIP